jgi:hypothetical protein
LAPQDNFGLLRTILRALGLSPEAVDDIVSRILDLLGSRDHKPAPADYPYHLRDEFLSPAEQSFYLVLRAATVDWGTVCPKVGLGDIFWAKSSDPSIYRTATNRIDRKHVDFLLCDPNTMRPLLGIELDDRSHQRADRQERDDFVEHVFAAAQLPLVRLPVRRAYPVAELRTLLLGQLGRLEPALVPPGDAGPAPTVRPARTIEPTATAVEPDPQQPLPSADQPRCPQCNAPMVLRTASRGPNQGGQFWGCPNYPRCRGMLRYDGQQVER